MESGEDLPFRINHPLHPDHILTLQDPLDDMRCNACHKISSESFFYECSESSTCKFRVDVNCVSRWQKNADDCKEHTVVPSMKAIPFTCQACGWEGRDIAYLCSDCRLLIHADCVKYRSTITTLRHGSLTRIYAVREVKGQEKVFCRFCYKEVNTEYGAYYCYQCRYIIHFSCAGENEDRTANGPVPCKLKEDEIDDPSENPRFIDSRPDLTLCHLELLGNERCEACLRPIISAPFYRSTRGNFLLHCECAELHKIIVRLEFHQHPLTLHSPEPSWSGLFYCSACKRRRHGFAYKCDECAAVTLDVQCCLIPERFEHKGHDHPLYLATRPSETCKGCGEEAFGNMLVCVDSDCRLSLCLKCATLPVETRHRYDTHHLIFSSAPSDEWGEYYCLICEEEIEEEDSEKWLYYCKPCDFTAHLQCVIGKNPYINFGRTYKDKDMLHRLAIVQTTEDTPPCKGCGVSFDQSHQLEDPYLAVECADCNSTFHYLCLFGLHGKVVEISEPV